MSSFAPYSETEAADPWWRRVGALLREQWIFASLLGLIWCGDTLLLFSEGGKRLLMIPGVAMMAVLGIFGRRHPVGCGLAALAVLGGNTAVAWVVNADLYSAGLESILPTENLVGLLLVLYLFRLHPLRKAVPVTALLVVACLAAVVIRNRCRSSTRHPGSSRR